MPRFQSNAERIARAAAEAEARRLEKARKEAAAALAPPSTARKPKPPKPPRRMKIIWAVGRPGEEALKTYPYLEREAADADAAKRGKGCRVLPLKVPME